MRDCWAIPRLPHTAKAKGTIMGLLAVKLCSYPYLGLRNLSRSRHDSGEFLKTGIAARLTRKSAAGQILCISWAEIP